MIDNLTMKKSAEVGFTKILKINILVLLFSFVAIFATLGVVDETSSYIPQRLGIGIFLGGSIMWFIITYILYHWRKVIGIQTLAKITKSCGLILLSFGVLTILSLMI